MIPQELDPIVPGPLSDNRKRKGDIDDGNCKKSRLSEGEDAVSAVSADADIDEGDREDGEIETSDDECVPDGGTVVKVAAAPKIDVTPTPDASVWELEAGEIENETVDNDDDSDASLGAGNTDELAKATQLDKSEFENYEPLYVHERPPLNTRDIARDSCRIEFL